MTGQETYANRLISFCDDAVDEAPRTPKGLMFIFEWGSLRAASNVLFICLQVGVALLTVNRSRITKLICRQHGWV